MAQGQRDAVETDIRVASLVGKRYHLSPGFDIEAFASDFVTVREEKIFRGVDAVFLYARKTNTPLILLNSGAPPQRRRFTLAHELGHFFIPWHVGTVICHTDPVLHTHNYLYQSMEAEANRFASELIMPSDWLRSLVSEYGSIEQTCDAVRESGVSGTAVNIALIKSLPAGRMFVQTNRSGQVQYSGTTEGTLARPPSKDRRFDPAIFAHIAADHEIIQTGLCTTHWFKFGGRQPISLRTPLDSKAILRELISSLDVNANRQKTLLCQINGVVGSANSVSAFASPHELADGLYQRFASREDLAFLLSHPHFTDFVQAKSAELFAKKRN